MAMQKILVVYFLRSGFTRKIAEAIATPLGADIECIQEVRGRSGVWGYLRSVREALRQQLPDIQPPARNPADYDLLILGTPVWASNMCSPMRAYIVSQKDKLASVALFCTQGGAGAIKVMETMAALCARKPAATLVLNDDEIKQDRYAGKLTGFLASISNAQAA